MALTIEISAAAVRTGQLDRSCRVRDPNTGAYEFFHPRQMGARHREMLERALELLQKDPDKWPNRATFKGKPRGYLVNADDVGQSASA